MARTEVSGSQIKDSSVALSAAASPTGASDVTGVLPATNGGTGLASPGASGNVLTSDGTNWTSAAGGGGGGGGGSARVTSTVTSAVTLDSAANTEYVTYIAAGGSVTLPTAVGNTSSYIIKNLDTTAKTIATTGDDPSWAGVTALFRGNGENNSTLLTETSTRYTWEYSTATVRLSTAVKKYGTGSIYFGAGGNNSCIRPPVNASNSYPGFGTADFTVEMWFYSTVAASYFLFDWRPFFTNGVYPTLWINASQKLAFYVSSADRITSTTSVAINTWHHAAVSRVGGVTKLFLNGVQEGSNYTDANNYLTVATSGQVPTFGNTGSGANGQWLGYLDEIRVTHGVGRYTANFTPPTGEFGSQELIDDTYPLVLAPNQAVEIASKGTGWSIVGDAAALPALTTTPTSASITTLTVESTPIQVFTGTTTHTLRLPTTGIVPGKQYTIYNNSSGAVTVQSSAATTILGVLAGTSATFTALVPTPTAASHWEETYLGVIVSSNRRMFVNNSLNFNGTDGTTMTFPTTNATIARTDAAQTFTGVQTFTTPVINGIPTGTGVATAATANTLVLRGAGGTVTGTFVETTTAVGTIGAAVTLALAGTVQTATLTSNTPCTVTMPAVSNGASFVLYLRQPATGTPTTATFSGVRWGTGGAPVITAVLGRMDILTFFSDGTNWFGQVAQGYQY
jgi:hypothetical protein